VRHRRRVSAEDRIRGPVWMDARADQHPRVSIRLRLPRLARLGISNRRAPATGSARPRARSRVSRRSTAPHSAVAVHLERSAGATRRERRVRDAWLRAPDPRAVGRGPGSRHQRPWTRDADPGLGRARGGGRRPPVLVSGANETKPERDEPANAARRPSRTRRPAPEDANATMTREISPRPDRANQSFFSPCPPRPLLPRPRAGTSGRTARSRRRNASSRSARW
jgi:hypothetical protein